MSIFDGLFNTGPQQDAARAQVQGIQTGLGQLGDLFSQGRGALTTTTGQGQGALGTTYGQGQNSLNANYAAGLSPFMTNFAQANQGSTALANALGLNGPQGNAAAIDAFKNNPGYQFGLTQGQNSIAAQAQAGGMGNSGNALLAAGQFGTNYANQNWNNYINQLQPYLGASNAAASGIGGLYSGLGNQLNASSMGLGQGLAGSQFALGQGLNQSFTNQGNAAYGANASIGNAYANADLAQAGANANILGAITGGLGFGANLLGKFSGSPSGNANSAMQGGFLSDVKAKEDIERVGKLDDGQPVYRYRYKGDPRHQIGLIAQEVEQVEPGAVFDFDGRYKGVDYRAATNFAAELARLAT